jgi:hypothetical protein
VTRKQDTVLVLARRKGRKMYTSGLGKVKNRKMYWRKKPFIVAKENKYELLYMTMEVEHYGKR